MKFNIKDALRRRTLKYRMTLHVRDKKYLTHQMSLFLSKATVFPNLYMALSDLYSPRTHLSRPSKDRSGLFGGFETYFAEACQRKRSKESQSYREKWLFRISLIHKRKLIFGIGIALDFCCFAESTKI